MVHHPILVLLLCLLCLFHGHHVNANDDSGARRTRVRIKINDGEIRTHGWTPPAANNWAWSAPVQERQPAAFSGHSSWSSLATECFTYTDSEYEWGLCPFVNATQRDKNRGYGSLHVIIGIWKEWEVKDGKYAVMRYTDGTACASGVKRSTTVVIACGDAGSANTVSDITEPAACSYAMKFTSPLFCGDALLAPANDAADGASSSGSSSGSSGDDSKTSKGQVEKASAGDASGTRKSTQKKLSASLKEIGIEMDKGHPLATLNKLVDKALSCEHASQRMRQCISFLMEASQHSAALKASEAHVCAEFMDKPTQKPVATSTSKLSGKKSVSNAKAAAPQKQKQKQEQEAEVQADENENENEEEDEQEEEQEKQGRVEGDSEREQEDDQVDDEEQRQGEASTDLPNDSVAEELGFDRRARAAFLDSSKADTSVSTGADDDDDGDATTTLVRPEATASGGGSKGHASGSRKSTTRRARTRQQKQRRKRKRLSAKERNRLKKRLAELQEQREEKEKSIQRRRKTHGRRRKRETQHKPQIEADELDFDMV